MGKVKTSCHICFATMKSETPPDVCPRCGANLANSSEETAQMSAHAQHTTGAMGGWMGWLYLTDRRLLFILDAISPSVMGGIVAGLVASAINARSGQKEFSIPLDEIQSVSDGKIGLFARAITVSDKNGMPHTLKMRGLREWKDALAQIADHNRAKA